jgi:hypothetical protein
MGTDVNVGMERGRKVRNFLPGD